MRRFCWLSLTLMTVLSAMLVCIPAFLIRPFVAQTQGGLALSYQLRSLSPTWTLAFLVIGILLTLQLWYSSLPRLRKSLIGLFLLILAASAVMARQNHFEWMFHPLLQPGYVSISKATHVKDADMVLGIRLGGDSRAYPISLMAYHHLVNDVVAGQPLVVTY